MVVKNKKKHQNFHSSNVGVDKMSNLPDELIHRILYFLPIKCAMSTCILSKRWKYVVNSIPILDFRNWQTREGTKKEKKLEAKLFMNFLDTLLFPHEMPNIQKFYLVLDKFLDESRVNRWISTIIRRRVKEFYICIEHSSTPSIFPLSFFTCDSLTLLDLDTGMTTVGKLFIPITVSFPKLKVLRLRNLSFVDETSTTNWFSNCPILEELRLNNCSIYEGLGIVNPSLKHLFIDFCFLSKSTATLKISAPNLLRISYIGNPQADFVLHSFPSLVEAEIGFYSDVRTCVVTKKLLEKFSTVKLLKMFGSCFRVSSEADFLLDDLPTLHNLIHLEVTSIFYCMSFGSNSVSAVRNLFRFLQLSPNLESIVFSQGIFIPEEEADDCWSLDPKVSPPHLKSIKFECFGGEHKELNAVKLFLKYAGSLETVTIVASPGLSKDQKKQLNVTKLLLMFPKPANCVVKFLEYL